MKMGYYSSQLKALIKRNILIKKAAKSSTIMEIFFPLFMVFMSYAMNKISETKKYNEANPTKTIDLSMLFKAETLIFQERNPAIGYILPQNDNNNINIVDKIKSNDMFQYTNLQHIIFQNQEEMNNYNNDYHNFLMAGVIFESDDYLHYTIRVNGSSAPAPTAEAITNYALGRYQFENTRTTTADTYMTIFSPIQSAVDQAIICLKTGDDSIIAKPQVGRLGKPKSEYVQSNGSFRCPSIISQSWALPQKLFSKRKFSPSKLSC